MSTIKYPIGIQNFRDLRRNGYIYVDKTEYVWRLATTGKYYFLSRPRRFGKSLLVSTLEAYFRGWRELFDGLAISGLETSWDSYPIFHLDLSGENYKDARTLYQGLDFFLSEIDREFGIDTTGDLTPALRFKSAIRQVAEQTGKPVVILIDEYDTPLTQTIHNPQLQEELRAILKGFYGVLKPMDGHIRFAMLTGVTRFSKVSIFSDLNNLRDISFLPDYNAVCGISESEIKAYFTPSVQSFAEARGLGATELFERLRINYDGYHFSSPERTEGIYNPFSVLNALISQSIDDYWFETGTPTYLVSLLKDRHYDLRGLNDIQISTDELSGLDIAMSNPIPLMYQSGYLTIKKHIPDFDLYVLGFPNQEVKKAFTKFLFPFYTPVPNAGRSVWLISNFIKDIDNGDIDGFMTRLQSLFADFPYDQVRDIELHYHNVLYLVFTLMGYYTRTEYRTSRGRADLVVFSRDSIYIFEFKLDKSPEEAIAQIKATDYAQPFSKDGRRIVKIGVNFSSLSRNIDGWIMEE